MKSARALLLVLIVSACQPMYAQWRLVVQSQDLHQPSNLMTIADTGNPIKSIESRGVLSRYLIVRYSHSKRRLVAKNSVWGFIDERGGIWRCYEKELFLVIKYQGGWVEYMIERPVRTRLTARFLAMMYSRTLDSKIRAVWSDAMADVPIGYILR